MWWNSESGEWGGDVDLNCGKCQQIYSDLHKSLKWINSVYCIKKDLQKALDNLPSDIRFISTGKKFLWLPYYMIVLRLPFLLEWTNASLLFCFQTINCDYKEELKRGHNGGQSMFTLSWDIDKRLTSYIIKLISLSMSAQQKCISHPQKVTMWIEAKNYPL